MNFTTAPASAEQKLLDQACTVLGDSPAIRSVALDELDGQPCLSVGVNTARTARSLPREITLPAGGRGKRLTLPVDYFVQPPLTGLFGRINQHPMHRTARAAGTYLGGAACGSARTPNLYGTMTVAYAKVSYKVGRHKCTQKPGILSNNHVIAAKDKGKKGDRLWFGQLGNYLGTLSCLVPLSDKSHNADLAMGTTAHFGRFASGQIHGIGLVSKIRPPKKGEAIRKFGARTGLTAGKVARLVNITVDGRRFKGVWETTAGFSCQGDSGSAVIAAGNVWVGIIAWGEKLDCEKKPRGYFFPIDKM